MTTRNRITTMFAAIALSSVCVFALAPAAQAAFIEYNFNDVTAGSTQNSVSSDTSFGGDSDSLFRQGGYANGGDPGSSFATATVGGQSTTVLSLPESNDLFDWIRINYNFGANGGGTQVNQYTWIIDARFPVGSAGYRSLFNTDKGGGLAQVYNSPTSGLNLYKSTGVFGSQQGGTLASDGTWYRIAVTVDLTTSTAIGYIDGVQVVSATTNTGLDGEWSATPNDDVFLYSATSGEVGPMDVSAIYMADEILSAGEIAHGGGANGTGIAAILLTPEPEPVPEPSTYVLGLIGLAGLGLFVLRNKYCRA